MFGVASRGIPSAGDLAWHRPVDVVTRAALPANTYNVSTQTLTANANGVIPPIDDNTVVAGWRVLVRNEATAKNNGIYDVLSIGSAGTPWILQRSGDANSSVELPAGSIVYDKGTAGLLYGLYFNLASPFNVLDTDQQFWVPTVSGGGSAGIGLPFQFNPPIGGAGTATFTLLNGWMLQLGFVAWVGVNLQVATVGTGGGQITLGTFLTYGAGGGNQILPAWISGMTTIQNGVAVAALNGGAGSEIGAIRDSNNLALNRAHFAVGGIVRISGMFQYQF